MSAGISLRHVPAWGGTERLAEHRHEARHALIAEVGGHLLSRSAAGQPLYSEHDAKLLAPPPEAHPRLAADQPHKRPLAQARLLRPTLQRAALRGGRHHEVDQAAQ